MHIKLNAVLVTAALALCFSIGPVAEGSSSAPTLSDGAWATMAELRRQLGDVAGARAAYTRALALREDPRLRARARSMGR